MTAKHVPVMLEEVLEGLNIKPEGIYVDATFGRGGHAKEIVKALSSGGRLVVMDKDPEAIESAKSLFSEDKRVTVVHTSFAKAYEVCKTLGLLGKVDGFLMDLGVSSPQLEEKGRGFSFKIEGPLDMRMDTTQGISAAEWLKTAEESDIASVLKTYGEERFYRRIARAIITERNQSPILSTLQLAKIVAKANPAWEKTKHPATRSFQAIRIFINHELEELSEILKHILDILAPQGRWVVISFHSLEDRMIKQFIQNQAKGDDYPKDLPILSKFLNPRLKKIGPKRKAKLNEVAQNARSRSAVLRIAEKLESQ